LLIGAYCERRTTQWVNAHTKRRANRAVAETNLRANQSWINDLPFKDDPLGIGKNSRELMMMVVNGELDEDTVPDSIANAAERLKDIRDERANMQVYFEARSPYGIRRKVIAAAASVFSKKFGFLVRESTVQRAWEEYRADRD
jgi:hypothetical protein